MVRYVPYAGLSHVNHCLSAERLSYDAAAAELGTAVNAAKIDDLLTDVDAATGCRLWCTCL